MSGPTIRVPIERNNLIFDIIRKYYTKINIISLSFGHNASQCITIIFLIDQWFSNHVSPLKVLDTVAYSCILIFTYIHIHTRVSHILIIHHLSLLIIVCRALQRVCGRFCVFITVAIHQPTMGWSLKAWSLLLNWKLKQYMTAITNFKWNVYY